MRLTPDGDLVPADSPRQRPPDRRKGRYQNPLHYFRTTHRWKKFRAEILERDGNRCITCGWTGSKANPLTASHLTPVSKDGAIYDPANVVCECRSCNSRRGARLPTGGHPPPRE